MCWYSVWLVLLAALTADPVAGVSHAFTPSVLLAQFKTVFPLEDGSELMSDDSALIDAALRELQKAGIPLNTTAFCAQSETDIVHALMLASLGNFVHGDAKYVADATDGQIVERDSWRGNRILVLECLVFALLIALAKSWFVLHAKVA